MTLTIIVLILCLFVVLAFEFVNGMNDTANAIAPVIYSHSLRPKRSVFIAAFLNFLGVLLGGTAVAMSILHLLPLSAIAHSSTSLGIILVISILFSAIIWDLGAWWFALPVSSSHALIGSILGVSIALTFVPNEVNVTPNWAKAREVIEGLFISPLLGFFLALAAIYFAHRVLQRKRYFRAPESRSDHPKKNMRYLLIISSCLVSFMHGKNDGQKGVGIATLILVTLLPSYFAVNPNMNKTVVSTNVGKIESIIEKVNTKNLSKEDATIIEKTKQSLISVKNIVAKPDWNTDDKLSLRRGILVVQENYKHLAAKKDSLIPSTNAAEASPNIESVSGEVKALSDATDYIPWWIIVLVSIAIGSGTMVGWRRIVKTIGEKIGKYPMNYSQAASSALVTAGTIGLASHFGLPVSTTHVMSSSVAGTMVEEHGWKKGVDPHMIKHIVMAWILTMPVTIILAGSIFLLFKFMFVH